MQLEEGTVPLEAVVDPVASLTEKERWALIEARHTGTVEGGRGHHVNTLRSLARKGLVTWVRGQTFRLVAPKPAAPAAADWKPDLSCYETVSRTCGSCEGTAHIPRYEQKWTCYGCGLINHVEGRR